MVLVQLYLERTLQYVNFPVKLMGRYKVKVAGLTYIYSGGGGVHEVLEIKSSVLNFSNAALDESLTNTVVPYSAFIFTNQSAHNVFTTGDAPEIICDINLYIDLYLGQLNSSVAPSNFIGLILTLDCIEVDKDRAFVATTLDKYIN